MTIAKKKPDWMVNGKKKPAAPGKSINRTPEESVKVAQERMNTKIEKGVNKEIKGIVDDIMSGNLKKAMSSDIGKKIGIKENAEPEATELEEKELILGGQKVDDGAGNKVVKNNIEDVTKTTKAPVVMGESEDTTKLVNNVHNFKGADNSKPMNGEKIGKITENELEGDDNDPLKIESGLNDLGYGTDENPEAVQDISSQVSEMSYGISEEDNDLDLSSILGEEDDENGEEAPVEAPENGEEAPVEAPIEAPIEAPVDGEIPADPETPEAPESDDTETGEEAPEIDIEEMNYDALNDKDKGKVDLDIKEMDDMKTMIGSELDKVGDAAMPKELKEKLEIWFEMYSDKKASIIARKKTATLVEKINRHLANVVKDYVKEKDAEIKEAIDSVKKENLYNQMTSLVEATFGTKVSDVMEAKKTENFLINVISEMKKETERLERVIVEDANKLDELKCKIIFNEATTNMVFTEKQRIASFLEKFNHTDPADFGQKLKLVIEQFNALKANGTVVKTVETKKTANITESKLEGAVKKQVINEGKNVVEQEVIDPDKYNWNIV